MQATSHQQAPTTTHENEDEILWNSQASKQNHQKCTRKIDITEVFKADQIFRNDDIVKKTHLTLAKELS